MTGDPYELQRFVLAQDTSDMYHNAVAELRRGRKLSHWMWFVFPQIAGLGASAASQRYAISGLDEAREYLGHPVLGPRLLEVTRIVAQSGAETAEDVFGPIDAQKLQSSVTLFFRAAPHEPSFQAVLDRLFGGILDARTDQLISGARARP